MLCGIEKYVFYSAHDNDYIEAFDTESQEWLQVPVHEQYWQIYMTNMKQQWILIFEAGAIRSGSTSSTHMQRKEISSIGINDEWETFKVRPSIHLMVKEIKHMACIDSDILILLNISTFETFIIKLQEGKVEEGPSLGQSQIINEHRDMLKCTYIKEIDYYKGRLFLGGFCNVQF